MRAKAGLGMWSMATNSGRVLLSDVLFLVYRVVMTISKLIWRAFPGTVRDTSSRFVNEEDWESPVSSSPTMREQGGTAAPKATASF